jgi:hypothetical protein
MTTVATADPTVWRTGDISIEIEPMEANSEKIPMMASTCELREIDFQASALDRLSGEL